MSVDVQEKQNIWAAGQGPLSEIHRHLKSEKCLMFCDCIKTIQFSYKYQRVALGKTGKFKSPWNQVFWKICLISIKHISLYNPDTQLNNQLKRMWFCKHATFSWCSFIECHDLSCNFTTKTYVMVCWGKDLLYVTLLQIPSVLMSAVGPSKTL